MNTFGLIKTKLEEASVVAYKNNKLDSFLKSFKGLVLENEDLCELYYIYEDLYTNKGLDRDIADDYINETVEYSKILIKENQEDLNFINSWLSKNNIINEHNNYKELDTLIYNDSIKNLENVLECKKQIKNILLKESKKETTTDSINLPLATMVKMYESNLKKNLSLNENELKEISEIKNLSKDEIGNEIKELSETIISKLKPSLNESTDFELNEKINSTITSVKNTKIDHYNLYKLRKLNSGL
ncbi:MAG: hypothetical protein RLZZ479_1546 [Bacteroidota bacterium]|jgi:hypothetical protein